MRPKHSIEVNVIYYSPIYCIVVYYSAIEAAGCKREMPSAVLSQEIIPWRKGQFCKEREKTREAVKQDGIQVDNARDKSPQCQINWHPRGHRKEHSGRWIFGHNLEEIWKLNVFLTVRYTSKKERKRRKHYSINSIIIQCKVSAKTCVWKVFSKLKT